MLMKKFLTLLLVFLLISSGHPFYLGITDLKYNAKEQALQGSVKLFVNDLEDALEKINKQTVDLINVKDSIVTHRLLELYLKTHLALKLNGKARNFELIGFEREEEAVWMYLEFNNCEAPEKIELKNTLLFDFLKNQANIVHITVGAEQKSWKAGNPECDFLFVFKK
jgi:hypothetical protein